MKWDFLNKPIFIKIGILLVAFGLSMSSNGKFSLSFGLSPLPAGTVTISIALLGVFLLIGTMKIRETSNELKENDILDHLI